MDFDEELYLAMKILGMSEEEFWQTSPITFNNLLEIHLEMERMKRHGK